MVKTHCHRDEESTDSVSQDRLDVNIHYNMVRCKQFSKLVANKAPAQAGTEELVMSVCFK